MNLFRKFSPGTCEYTLSRLRKSSLNLHWQSTKKKSKRSTSSSRAHLPAQTSADAPRKPKTAPPKAKLEAPNHWLRSCKAPKIIASVRIAQLGFSMLALLDWPGALNFSERKLMGRFLQLWTLSERVAPPRWECSSSAPWGRTLPPIMSIQTVQYPQNSFRWRLSLRSN